MVVVQKQEGEWSELGMVSIAAAETRRRQRTSCRGNLALLPTIHPSSSNLNLNSTTLTACPYLLTCSVPVSRRANKLTTRTTTGNRCSNYHRFPLEQQLTLSPRRPTLEHLLRNNPTMLVCGQQRAFPFLHLAPSFEPYSPSPYSRTQQRTLPILHHPPILFFFLRTPSPPSPSSRTSRSSTHDSQTTYSLSFRFLYFVHQQYREWRTKGEDFGTKREGV